MHVYPLEKWAHWWTKTTRQAWRLDLIEAVFLSHEVELIKAYYPKTVFQRQRTKLCGWEIWILDSLLRLKTQLEIPIEMRPKRNWKNKNIYWMTQHISTLCGHVWNARAKCLEVRRVVLFAGSLALLMLSLRVGLTSHDAGKGSDTFLRMQRWWQIIWCGNSNICNKSSIILLTTKNFTTNK